MSYNQNKLQPKKKKPESKKKWIKSEMDNKKYRALTISKLQHILESPPHKANRAILKYNHFIDEAESVLSALPSVERRNFLNRHINDSTFNKWNELKNRFMDVSESSFQRTPLTISFYNFTYQHTSTEASKIWCNFILLILNIEDGAESDLKHCDLDDCNTHLTIIAQLYAYVNTSDGSFYSMNTQEFRARGGFKLLSKAFNSAGVNNPIPPIILSLSECKQYEFLQSFSAHDFEFLYCISPNEVGFSWIKQMLHNGHPIMSNKQYVHQLLQTFYPLMKVPKDAETDEDEKEDDDDDDDIKDETDQKEEDEMMELVRSETARISTGSMNAIGAFAWLLSTLPCLLDVRTNQKIVLKKEFDKYQETAANSTLIDTMLDYLYWDEKYIHEVLHKVQQMILDNDNEDKLFTFLQMEYGGMVSMPMFMKGFIEFHMNNNRDILSVLFDNDTHANNAFYFKMIKIIFRWGSMVAQMDRYLPFILSKIAKWNTINQELFDELLTTILSYIERYVSDKSTMMKLIKKQTCNKKADQTLSKMVDVKRQRMHDTVSNWIIKIFMLLDNTSYTHQFIYHLGLLHFRFQNDSVEEFTLCLYQQLLHEFDIDLVYITPDKHVLKSLVVRAEESILWLLCRCCFDKAVRLFLTATKDKTVDLFYSKQVGDKLNNVFLCLSKGIMPDHVIHTKEIEQARLDIFRMLVDFGGGRIEVRKALTQNDGNNEGKNAIESAKDNYQSLYNEMKQFIMS